MNVSHSSSGRPKWTRCLYGAKNSLLVQVTFQLSLSVLLIPLGKVSVTTQSTSLLSPSKYSPYLYHVSGSVLQCTLVLRLRPMLLFPTERSGRLGHIIPMATTLSSHLKVCDAGGGVPFCSVLGCSWFSFHTLISYISACSLPSRLPGKGLKLLLNISISPGGHLFSRDCLGLSAPSPAAGSCCSDKLELGEAGQQALSHRVPDKHSSALLRPRVAQSRLALRPSTTWQQPPAVVNITVLTGPQLSKLIWLNLIRLRGTFDLWN